MHSTHVIFVDVRTASAYAYVRLFPVSCNAEHEGINHPPPFTPSLLSISLSRAFASASRCLGRGEPCPSMSTAALPSVVFAAAVSVAPGFDDVLSRPAAGIGVGTADTPGDEADCSSDGGGRLAASS